MYECKFHEVELLGEAVIAVFDCEYSAAFDQLESRT